MYARTELLTGTHHEVSYSWGYIQLRIAKSTGLADMSIHVEEEYRGKGFSRQLVRDLAYAMLEKETPATVYIDTDASSGFWDKVGFQTNPNLDQENVPEFGYEKCIAWRDLIAFGKPRA